MNAPKAIETPFSRSSGRAAANTRSHAKISTGRGRSKINRSVSMRSGKTPAGSGIATGLCLDGYAFTFREFIEDREILVLDFRHVLAVGRDSAMRARIGQHVL